ncbi:CPBP family intramembrane glutamic endopeptidase [Erwinia sp. JUb26]|uniref:CPBP family intramembrane glutamic endopeptidase n=1 Tax=Erwinia sp. JUb26 TaxID=2485126 RepID=UPI000F46CBEB|nr:CPBP family intramembrane glutamic endopeptidase [Erwinia sp. JUb26]ROR08725.1 hypothetical protein EC836_105153 [Erwinia sp. JUb26]
MWLLLALSLLFLSFSLRSALVLLVITLAIAIVNQTLLPPGIIALGGMFGIALCWGYRQRPTPFALPGEILLVSGAIALVLHLIPGFNNQIAASGVQAGPQSLPFTFSFNLDKALIPFLLLGCMPTLFARPSQPPQNPLWWLILLLSMPLLLLVATVLGALRVEPHVPGWIGSFMLANLFFVCLAEEALFRGYIQQRLSPLIGDKRALVIASVLFGLAHFSGGLMLVFFATLTGVIYGLAWLWSGRLWVATLVHFSFNMLHLLFFTYPVWQRLPT